MMGSDGVTVRRNKGRGRRHIAMLSPLEVLERLADTSGPRGVEEYVKGLLEAVSVSAMVV